MADGPALIRPTSGEMLNHGRPLQGVNPNVAIVFQSDNLFTWLSARANVELSLSIGGARRDRDAIEQALDAFGLASCADVRAGLLSGGEQQRTAIAAAAVRRARLVLADEPTAELDERNEQLVLDALHRLRDDFGSTVVVVTHSVAIANGADRVVEIVDGRVA